MVGILKQEDYDEGVAQSSPHILAMSPTHHKAQGEGYHEPQDNEITR
jgi:hypothetical protein